MRPWHDILEEQADVAERVRKLEIMDHSRTLIPKSWKPHNPALDIAVGFVVRALGLQPIHRGPLSTRIMPEVDWLWFNGGEPNIKEMWLFLLQTGYGPQFWAHDLEALAGPGGRGAFAFFTGSGPFRRWWVVGGITAADWYDTGTPPPGGANIGMSYYASRGAFGGSGVAWPEGGYLEGRKIVGDSRIYQTPGMVNPAPCEVPPWIENKQFDGTAHAYLIPVQNAGCPDNPLHPQYSSGYLDARYYTQNPAELYGGLPTAVDLAPSGTFMSGNDMPMFGPVSYETLRRAVELSLEAHPVVADWFAQVIPVAQSELRTPTRMNWQTLPLYPGWWGRIECRYDARFVYFRGRARCNGTPTPGVFAAYPNWLPIGPLIGSYMPAQLDTGAPITIRLSHDQRTEAPTDYIDGEGSSLGLYRPGPSEITHSGDPAGVEVVMDGCRFGIYAGPFDGSHSPYPDLRA